MPKLFQINSFCNTGSTGRIAENLGLTVMKEGWESWIAYGRTMNPSKSRVYKIGDEWDVRWHGVDDMLLPGIISRYIQLLENPQLKDYDYISGIDEYVNSKGKLIKEIGSAPAWSKMKKEMVAAHVGSLHNKRLFSSFGLFDLHFKICADYELLIRKKDKLKYLFVPYHIAKMAAGGISCSNQAVKEAFLIRRKNHSVNSIMNIYILIRGMCSLIILKGKLK